MRLKGSNVRNTHVYFRLADERNEKVSRLGCCAEKTSKHFRMGWQISVRVIDSILAYFEVLCEMLAATAYDLLVQCFRKRIVDKASWGMQTCSGY